MKLQVYVAGRTNQTEKIRFIQHAAEQNGDMEITHDWTGKEGGIKPDWSHHPEEALEVATKDLKGVMNADAVILCGYGCGEGEKGGLGCFIEVGIALAIGIPVVIIGPVRESVFWYLPNVERIPHSEGLSFEEEIWAALRVVEGMVKEAAESRPALKAK